MRTTRRMRLAIVAIAAVLGMVTVATAHEPGKKMPESKRHSMDMHEPMPGMSEGSRELHRAMMGGMEMPMKMTGNVDTDFATMMTMHHQQAIVMSDVLIKYGKSAELRALAQKMKAAQLDEIKQMAPYAANK